MCFVSWALSGRTLRGYQVSGSQEHFHKLLSVLWPCFVLNFLLSRFVFQLRIREIYSDYLASE